MKPKLIDQIMAEVDRFGLAKSSLSVTLPILVHQSQAASRKWLWTALLIVLLSGIILGGGGSLFVLWNQLDAMRGSNARMAASCLNPQLDRPVTKSQAQVIVQGIEDRSHRGRN